MAGREERVKSSTEKRRIYANSPTEFRARDLKLHERRWLPYGVGGFHMQIFGGTFRIQASKRTIADSLG